jgi:hypothetical protein
MTLNGNPIYNEYLARYKAMNQEQKNIFNQYFKIEEGCLAVLKRRKNLDPNAYFNLVLKKAEEICNLNVALNKLGIDEEQVQEIPPFSFGGFNYSKSLLVGDYSNLYECTWLMFSDKQVYVYSLEFDMLGDYRNERMAEYFYKDVTNITTTNLQTELFVHTQNGCGQDKLSKVLKTTNQFKIVVPGEQYVCQVATADDQFKNNVSAAKAKLREKKEQ